METHSSHKIVILAAPSGAGKTTIMARMMEWMPDQLSFSVSSTTRAPREGERDGVDYFFISEEQFKNNIEADGFLEWEMVYNGQYYGTTKKEMERIWNLNKVPLLDIDVYGAMKVKSIYGSQVLSIFIQPPSLQTLRERLIQRGKDSMENIEKRLAKAAEEIAQKIHFDTIVVNDDLNKACENVHKAVVEFLKN
ncbi:MAG: hypothetical protein RL131_153 [Bacteroidota bacterium]